MRSLYELCLEKIVNEQVNITGLPKIIVEQINIYKKEYPLRISFPDRWDSQSIIDLCKELDYPLLEEDLYQIGTNPRYWLYDPNILNILCEEFITIFRLALSITKQINIIKAFVKFIYYNSGILALKIFEETKLIKEFEKRLIQILAVQGRKWFDDHTIKMCEELYGCSINKIHKKECWKNIHKNIQTIPFQKVVNREFPLTIGRIFTEVPHNIRNNWYWQGEMRNAQGAEIYSGTIVREEWTWNRHIDHFGYWSEKWWFNDILIYEEGYCDYRGNYSIDYTLEEKDGLNSPLLKQQQVLLFGQNGPF